MQAVTKALTLFCVLYLVACASPQPQRMAPHNVDRSVIEIPKTLRILVRGGGDAQFGGHEILSNEEFSVPLATAMQKFAMFSSISDVSPDLLLQADIGAQQQGLDGLAYSAAMPVRFHILEASTGEELWTGAVTGRHTATFGDAFSGAKRTVLAREGAVRSSIEMLLELLRRDSIAANRESTTLTFLDK